jgi:hypothetical protein
MPHGDQFMLGSSYANSQQGIPSMVVALMLACYLIPAIRVARQEQALHQGGLCRWGVCVGLSTSKEAAHRIHAALYACASGSIQWGRGEWREMSVLIAC